LGDRDNLVLFFFFMTTKLEWIKQVDIIGGLLKKYAEIALNGARTLASTIEDVMPLYLILVQDLELELTPLQEVLANLLGLLRYRPVKRTI
jgi:hypothetical protein